MTWPARYEWVPAPVAVVAFTDGKRWRLRRDGRDVGRVVQLLPGGLWEGSMGLSWYSPGHTSLTLAARALLSALQRDGGAWC